MRLSILSACDQAFINNGNGLGKICYENNKLVFSIILICSINCFAGEVEEGPPGIGCAGCSNNQTMVDEYNRQQMINAASYAEAQRAMQAQIEAQMAADRKRAQESDQAKQKQEARTQCLQSALSNKKSCTENSDRNLKSYNGTCGWMVAGGAASAIVGAIVAVPTFGWGAAAGAATFGAAATICYVNAQGAYNQQLNTCGLKYDNQMLNSCGRI